MTTASWNQVSGSKSHNLAISKNGALFSWGSNQDGALGLNVNFAGIPLRSEPTQIGTSSWSQVAAGYYFSLAIRSDGTLWAWGNNTNGQLGTNNRTRRSSPVQVGTSSWTQVAVTALNQVAAIKLDGTLWTWGFNGNGELGFDDTVTRSSPVQIGSDTWSKVVCSEDGNGVGRFLAIKSNGTLWGWGSSSGLGNGIKLHTNEFAIGNNTSLFINYDQNLYAQGDNEFAQAGIPALSNTNNWIDYEICSGTSYFIDENNNLYGVGLNTFGQLGQNDIVHRSSPVLIATNAKKLAKLKSQADDYDDDGFLGYIGTDDRLYTCGQDTLKVDISWTQVAESSSYYLGIRSDGTLWFWGSGTDGQGADGFQVTDRTGLAPSQIAGSWTFVSTSSFGAVFGIKTGGTLWAWGNNEYGDLGLGDRVHRSSPVQVPGTWSKISAGWLTLGIKSNGTLWSWGDGTFGSGRSDEIMRSSPVQIGAATDWTFVASSEVAGGFAIRNGAGLYAWGDNEFGNLGDNTQIHRSSPVQIGAATDWTYVDTNSYHTAGIRFNSENPALYAWGHNSEGTLGDNTTVHRSSPVLINASLGWQAVVVSAGSFAYFDGNPFLEGEGGKMVAAKTDGTLWTWGSNKEGNIVTLGGGLGLGSGDTVHRSSPTQIGSLVLNEGLTNINVISKNYATLITANDTIYAITAGIVPSTYTTLYVPISSDLIGATIEEQFLPYDDYGYSRENRSSPVVLGYHQKFKEVAMTEAFGTGVRILAIQTNGTLWGWGGNTQGSLGLNSQRYISLPTLVSSNNDWKSISTANNSSGGLREGLDDDNLYTWGWNFYGQLGTNSRIHRSSPVLLSSYSNDVVAFDTSGYHCAAIIETFPYTNPRLYTWGLNSNGQLGINSRIHRSSPTMVGDKSWGLVHASGRATMAVESQGLAVTAAGLYVFGTGLFFGVKDTVESLAFGGSSSPVLVDAFGTKRDLTFLAGFPSSSSTTPDLYNGRILKLASAVGNTAIPLIAANHLHGYLLSGTDSRGNSYTRGNTVFAWGSPTASISSFGAFAFDEYSSPTLVLEDVDNRNIADLTKVNSNTWSKISTSAYGNFTLAIANDGSLWSWGRNDKGQLGLNSIILAEEPQLVDGGSWSYIHSSGLSSYAIRNDGALFSWGDNSAGQLGIGSRLNRSSPVQIGSSSWTQVTGKGVTISAITSTNRLFAWGNNSHGQLGFSSRFHRSSPVQIGFSSWTQVETGIQHTIAIRADGRLYSWGRNFNGELGIGVRFHRSSPVLVGAKTWNSISAGSFHSLAVDSDNLLYAWGYNDDGQLGIGLRVSRSFPVLIGSTRPSDFNQWQKIETGTFSSLAKRGNNYIYDDSVLFGWGNNVLGALNSDLVSRSLPVTVGASFESFGDGITKSSPVLISTRIWSDVTTGFSHSAGITNDVRKKLYVWGRNQDGQIGDLPTEEPYRFSPVTVGSGTNFPAEYDTVSRYKSVSAGNNYTMMIKQTGIAFGTGINDQGQLGDGTTISRSSPTQVASNSRFVSVEAGDKKTVGIRF